MKPTLFFLFLFLPVMAVAQSNTGADLRNTGADYLHVCEGSSAAQPTPRPAVCNVWVTGVVDGLQAYNANTKTPLFNAPEVTVGQVFKLVARYLTDNPDKQKLPTAGLVLAALVQAYPPK